MGCSERVEQCAFYQLYLCGLEISPKLGLALVTKKCSHHYRKQLSPPPIITGSSAVHPSKICPHCQCLIFFGSPPSLIPILPTFLAKLVYLSDL